MHSLKADYALLIRPTAYGLDFPFAPSRLRLLSGLLALTFG